MLKARKKELETWNLLMEHFNRRLESRIVQSIITGIVGRKGILNTLMFILNSFSYSAILAIVWQK